MSQSYFSQGFLSQNSLWKLSTIRGYKGYLYWCVFGMQKVRFVTQKVKFVTNKVVWWLGLATWLSCESEPQANCLAKLEVLSCNALASVTLQLPYMLHMCASFSDLSAARSSHKTLLSAHSWAFLHTLSHTTLTWIPPKYRVSKCWITNKLARNKANKMVD